MPGRCLICVCVVSSERVLRQTVSQQGKMEANKILTGGQQIDECQTSCLTLVGLSSEICIY